MTQFVCHRFAVLWMSSAGGMCLTCTDFERATSLGRGVLKELLQWAAARRHRWNLRARFRCWALHDMFSREEVRQTGQSATRHWRKHEFKYPDSHRQSDWKTV